MKIIIMTGLIFVWSIQPYSIIIRLVIITLGYSIYIYCRIGRYWYRYILVLVVLRGVLVLFTYIASLVPNERFEYISLVYVSIFIYIIIIFGLRYKFIFYEDRRILILKVWEIVIRIYNLYLVIFLLVIILIVVWLRNFDGGAVRNFYNSAWIKG